MLAVLWCTRVIGVQIIVMCDKLGRISIAES